MPELEDFLGLCTFVWDDSDNADLDKIASMGINYVRLDKPSQTEIEDCRSRGLECLPIAAYNPWYATLGAPGASDDKYPPTVPNMPTWAANMVDLWDGLATQPIAIECWNEPWDSSFWKSAPNAADYYQLIRALADAAWDVWPDMTILWAADTAGSSPYDSGTWRTTVLAQDVGTGENVLPNGGFETDTSYWGTVLTATITRSATTAYAGSYSLLVETGTDFGGAAAGGLGGSGGHIYEKWWASGWIKAKEAGDVGKVVDVILIQEGTGEQENAAYTLTADWQYASVTATMATQGTSMRVDFRAHDNVATSFYVDEVSLFEEASSGFLTDPRVLPVTHNYVEDRTPTYHHAAAIDRCKWDFDRYECAWNDLVAHGHANPQVWVTEFGWSTGLVTEQQQSDYVVEAIEIARTSNHVAKLFGFALNYDDATGYNWVDGDGDNSDNIVVAAVAAMLADPPPPQPSALYETLLAADRPVAWWGLDSVAPTYDDSGHGYTLTAVGAPVNQQSLLTYGDYGDSGSREFDGTGDAYYVNGTLYAAPTEPPAFHSAVTVEATAATLTLVIPPDIKANDLLIFSMTHDTAAATVSSAPSDWTQIGSTVGTGNVAVATYKLVPAADLAPRDYTWVWSASAELRGILLVYRGADTGVSGLVYDAGAQSTASSTQHASTTETNPAQARAVVFWADSDTTADITPESTGLTIRAALHNPEEGAQTRMIGIDYPVEAASAVVKRAVTNINSTPTVTLITFGSPQTVAEDVLDTLDETISIHALIRPDTVAAGTRTIIRKRGSWGLQLNAATVEFVYTDGGGTDRTITGPTVSASTVTHLVVTDDGTNIHFYKDGVETTASRTGSAGYTTNTNRVVIGAHHTGAAYSNYFDGRLDEVAIWNVPISDQMVATYYEAHSAGTFGELLDDANTRLPRIKLEVAWASRPTDECLVWEDMTGYLRSTYPLAIRRGRNLELDRIEAGRMDFALSSTEREFDPDYTGSPFYPNVKPVRAVRLRAQVQSNGTVYSRFFGYTEGWPQRRTTGASDTVAVFTAIDAFKTLSLNKVTEPMARPNELAGARIESLLEDLPNVKYELDVGQSEIVGGNLEGVNRLDHTQAVVETDGGIIFCQGDGTVTFHDRHHRTINEQTVRATYGDGGGTEWPLAHQEPAVDEAHLYTAARITDAAGNIAESVNADAGADYFVRTKELSTLHNIPNEAQGMADAYANRYSTPRTRIPQVRLNPHGHYADPLGMWDVVLGHDIGQRIKTVERVNGSPVTREHYIEGIQDEIAPYNWRVAFSVSPAELEGNYWLLGTGELGDTSGITSTALGW